MGHSIDIGQRVNKRRKELDISLRQLGEACQVSAAFLSKVENGKISPSLALLQQLALHLQISLPALLRENDQPNLVRSDERRKMYFKDVPASYELLTPDIGGDMLVSMVHLNPNSFYTQERRNRVEKFIYVVNGALQINIADESQVLRAGDSIYFNSDLLQEYRSIESEGVDFILTSVPPSF